MIIGAMLFGKDQLVMDENGQPAMTKDGITRHGKRWGYSTFRQAFAAVHIQYHGNSPYVVSTLIINACGYRLCTRVISMLIHNRLVLMVKNAKGIPCEIYVFLYLLSAEKR